jgi:RNA polymerase sigma factor (sigma-70 family)
MTGNRTTSDAAVQEVLLSQAESLYRYVQTRIPRRYQQTISAEDVLQDVWIAVSEHGLSGVRDHGRWLTTLANSKLVDAIRRAGARKRGGGAHPQEQAIRQRSSLDGLFARAATPTPSREYSAHEARHAVQVALAGLAQDQRDAVRMRYIDGLPHEEIARAMQKSRGAVNSLLFRGLRELRNRIGQAAKYFSDVRSADGSSVCDKAPQAREDGP